MNGVEISGFFRRFPTYSNILDSCEVSYKDSDGYFSFEEGSINQGGVGESIKGRRRSLRGFKGNYPNLPSVINYANISALEDQSGKNFYRFETNSDYVSKINNLGNVVSSGVLEDKFIGDIFPGVVDFTSDAGRGRLNFRNNPGSIVLEDMNAPEAMPIDYVLSNNTLSFSGFLDYPIYFLN